MADSRKLTLTILGDAKSALRAIGQTDSKLGALGSAAKTASKVAGVALLGGFTAAGAGAFAAVKQFSDFGDGLQEMSQRTGTGVEWLSAMKYAADLSGTSIEGVEKSIKKMSSTVEDAKDGLSTTVLAFDKLGVSVADLEGLSPEQQFDKLAAAIAGVEDETQRAALAQDIFGRGGVELLPIFADGVAGLEAMKKEARDLGIVMSEEDAQAAADFADGMAKLQMTVKGFSISVARELIPLMIKAGEWLGPRLEEGAARGRAALALVQAWIDENRPQIEAFFERAREVAMALWDNFKRGVETVLPLLISLGKWIVDNKPVLVLAILAIGVAIVTALGPVSLAALAIIGIITAIGWMRDNWQSIGDKIKEIVAGIKDWIVEHMDLIALALGGPVLLAVVHFRDDIKNAFETVEGVVRRVAQFIMDRVDDIKSAISSIPSLSDIPGAGLVGGVAGGIAGAIPGRASGGPVSAGQAYRVGERGAETFVPRVPGMIVPGGGGGGVVINVNVSGAYIGERGLEEAVTRGYHAARASGAIA